MRSLIAAAFMLFSTSAWSLDAACTTTPNLGMARCPEDSEDWYESYTGQIDELDALARTAKSSFTVAGGLLVKSSASITGAGGLGVAFGVSAATGAFTNTAGTALSVSSNIVMTGGQLVFPDGTGMVTAATGGGTDFGPSTGTLSLSTAALAVQVAALNLSTTAIAVATTTLETSLAGKLDDDVAVPGALLDLSTYTFGGAGETNTYGQDTSTKTFTRPVLFSATGPYLTAGVAATASTDTGKVILYNAYSGTEYGQVSFFRTREAVNGAKVAQDLNIRGYTTGVVGAASDPRGGIGAVFTMHGARNNSTVDSVQDQTTIFKMYYSSGTPGAASNNYVANQCAAVVAAGVFKSTDNPHNAGMFMCATQSPNAGNTTQGSRIDFVTNTTSGGSDPQVVASFGPQGTSTFTIPSGTGNVITIAGSGGVVGGLGFDGDGALLVKSVVEDVQITAAGAVRIGTLTGTRLYYCSGGSFDGHIGRGSGMVCTGGTATALGTIYAP